MATLVPDNWATVRIGRYEVRNDAMTEGVGGNGIRQVRLPYSVLDRMFPAILVPRIARVPSKNRRGWQFSLHLRGEEISDERWQRNLPRVVVLVLADREGSGALFEISCG